MRELHMKWDNIPVIFHADKAIYLPKESLLVISDLHLGKTGHFRKNGIPIPVDIAKKDLERLGELIMYYQPRSLIIAGDFFHAQANSEIELFIQWKKKFGELNFVLVKGNHDRLKKSVYQELGFELIPNYLELGEMVITHDFDQDLNCKQISGHVHPGIVLKGISKQRLRIPVFAYNNQHLLLPAFSIFTGLYTKFNVKDYQCIGLANNELFEV